MKKYLQNKVIYIYFFLISCVISPLSHATDMDRDKESKEILENLSSKVVDILHKYKYYPCGKGEFERFNQRVEDYAENSSFVLNFANILIEKGHYFMLEPFIKGLKLNNRLSHHAKDVVKGSSCLKENESSASISLEALKSYVNKSYFGQVLMYLNGVDQEAGPLESSSTYGEVTPKENEAAKFASVLRTYIAHKIFNCVEPENINDEAPDSQKLLLNSDPNPQNSKFYQNIYKGLDEILSRTRCAVAELKPTNENEIWEAFELAGILTCDEYKAALKIASLRLEDFNFASKNVRKMVMMVAVHKKLDTFKPKIEENYLK